MTSVFIGGSRRLGRINSELAHRLDNIIDRKLCVLVGDANGFDRAAQAYLADRSYREVVVYCTAGICRNNVGNWPIHAVGYLGTDRGLEFYTAKDDAMLSIADFGFFAWDGKSRGTLRNVQIMANRQRPSAVYVSPLRKFMTVRTPMDAAVLSESMTNGPSPQEDLFSDQWRVTVAIQNGCAEQIGPAQ